MEHIVIFEDKEIHTNKFQYIKHISEASFHVPADDDTNYSAYHNFVADGVEYDNMKYNGYREIYDEEGNLKPVKSVIFIPMTDEDFKDSAMLEMAEIISEQNEAIDELASLISELMEG